MRILRLAGLALAGIQAAVLPLRAQGPPISHADSALVARILLAEDQRDSSSGVFGESAAHGDGRIRTLARRALDRTRDPRFASRDSFPAPAAPPVYADPAWRLRLRALTGQRSDCAAMRSALADSAWPVRLRAAALVTADCGTDAALVRTLRDWASSPPATGARRTGNASWHPAAHALLALARIAPDEARPLLPRPASSPVPWLRVYAARAAGALKDTATLRRLARDANDNVKEAAIDSLARIAGHAADDDYLSALSAPGYQAVRAAARALAGSPRGNEVVAAALAASLRLQRDSSETSRDARLALLERIGEFAQPAAAPDVARVTSDFDCAVARAASAIAIRLGATGATPRCAPLPVVLPPDAVALALGREVLLRVVMADSSGGGAFTVRLRGDVAPLMAARVLALARSGYYDGRTWHRVEHDFVLQGGGGASEYVGHPRFIRDELGTLPHARGTVGMSTRGHDTGDAQWFVNLRDNLRLGRDYTVFGEVIDGIEVVDGVLEGDVIARIEVIAR